MPQKKWKFNVIDVIAIVLIVAVIFFVAFKLLRRGGEREMIPITYQVMIENQPIEMYEAVQQYIPCRIMASGALYDAEVTAVDAEHTLVCSEGEWVEDPDHVDLLFTVTGEVEKTAVMVPTIGTQEIRIGNEIILKTEYIEFDPAYVVNVEYPG